MKVGNIFILLSVIVVVFLAGCAEQKTVEEGGVSIEKFTPQVSTVASKSPVELTLIVENIGEREAKEVKAVLGGLTFLPSEFSGSAEEAQQYWKLESETLMKYLDTSSVISVAAENSNLLGEDIESGFKGEQGIVTWRLTAPIQARDQTYEPTVNVVYNYSTISTVLVKAVDFNYFQSLPEAEQASVGTGIIVSKITKGPLDITIKSDQAIISGGATLPIEIEFKNVGGGRTFIGGHAEVNATELYKSIKNVGIGAGLDKILVELPSDIQCNLKLTNGRYEVRLIEGKTGRLLCNKVIGKVSTVQTLSMDIKAEYRYLIEGKTSIKVSKTLYKVPIVDISVLDSTLELVADHDFSAYASIQLAVKNVGNQNIEKINIPIKYSVIADSKLVDESDITVYKDTDSPLIPFSTKFYPEDIKLLGLGVLLPSGTKEVKIDISAPQIKIGSLEEKNTANNKMSSSMVVDYDIAVESLKAEVVGKPNPLSTKITAIIKNNAENVKVRSIPTEIKVDNVELDYTKQCSPDNNIELTSGYVRVKELTKRASQEISCIYDNSEGKLEFNIIASISKSISDLKPDNDANDKPNNKPNPFKSTQPAPPPEQVIEPPLVSLGTSIISPADNTWQGTDKITMNVQDTGVTSCSVTVQDETQITANKLTRTCNEDVMINLKSSCSTNENCCSIEGEGKCKVTLFSSDGKQEYTASRTFNIDRKPPTITSLVIKDRLTGSTATAGRGLTLELSIKDESTSLVRNTASGIDTCKFIETYRDLSLPAGSSDVPVKTSNWTSCDTKILKADAYVNSNAFNYWSKLSSPDDFTSKITVHARDKAGNIATTGPGGVLTNAKTIVIKAPTETVSINDVNNGLTGTHLWDHSVACL
ncbi:MAG: hypothetical protein HYS80_01675 [Candidatus Aenigmarchaeota archaeon]|nr:hypothetical protein [Candidatus Aenigmarchaeota archaeon]